MVDVFALAMGFTCLLHGLFVRKINREDELSEAKIRKERRKFMLWSIFFFVCAILKFLFVGSSGMGDK